MSIIAAFMVPHPPMIIPEVGRGSEAQIKKTIDAYTKAAEEIAALSPETIVISSPHAVMYGDYFHISPGDGAKGSFVNFRVPEVKFDEIYDTEFVEKLCASAKKQNFPAGTLGERDRVLDHGTMVPLYFIRKKLKNFKIVRIGLSGLPLTEHYALGQLVGQTAEETGRRVVYVASGDLSHKLKDYGPYGFAPEGPEYDERIMDVCSRGAFGELFDFKESFCDKAAECGHRSFVIMAGALDGVPVKAEMLSHEDVTGVGYGICMFFPEDSAKKNLNCPQTGISCGKTENTKGGRHEAGEGYGADERHEADGRYELNSQHKADWNPMEEEKTTKIDDRRFLKIYLEQKQSELKKRQDQSDVYVKLARESLEEYIRFGKRISVEEGLRKIGISENVRLDAVRQDAEKKNAARQDNVRIDRTELTTVRAGAFVSIHEHGKLRGCIGTILPTTDCVAEEIIQNAVSASTRDPRFDPITEKELPWLEINVDVLGEPEAIPSKEMLDVKRYGVIVTRGRKRGLLLPDLESVDTVDQQIAIAMQKAGIAEGEPVELERFEVVRHV